jgi:hypothetical protein
MTVHCWVAEAQVLVGGGEGDEEQPVAGDGLVCAEEAVAVGGTGAGCSQFRGSFGLGGMIPETEQSTLVIQVFLSLAW